MTTLREAAQQALEALSHACDAQSNPARREFPTIHDFGQMRRAHDTLRTALQTPPPPPEAQTDGEKNAYHYGWWAAMKAVREQRKPLTDEKVIEHFQTQVDTGSWLSFEEGVRYAERAHGIGGEA